MTIWQDLSKEGFVAQVAVWRGKDVDGSRVTLPNSVEEKL